MEKEEKKESGAPAWMATFADLSTLLLTFFILILSFAEMDIVKFKDALGSIQQALGFLPTGTGMFKHSTTPSFQEIPMPKPVEQKHIINNAIERELKELVKENNLESDVDIQNSKRGIILRAQGRLFFNVGTSQLKAESHPILQKIADLMKKFPRRISIEGHTDNIPVSGGRYSSNWELSTARAFSALKFLQDSAGVEVDRINIAGFADTRPVAPNDTPEGRAKNRRVEFVFFEE